MGLGIQVKGTVNSTSLLFFKTSKSGVLTKIQKFYENINPDYGPIVKSTRNSNELLVSLHPAAEEVSFRFEADKLVCDAKTSDAGPGYHDFLITSLESLGNELNIDWKWGRYSDETKYHSHKNFNRLQLEMAYLFRGIAKTNVDEKLHKVHISMPIGFQIDADYSAISALGFWDKQFFAKVAKEQNDQTLLEYASNFFPWWENGFTARFWLNTALVLLWTQYPCREPYDAEEKQLLQIIHGCLAKAYSLDRNLPFPWPEWSELAKFLQLKGQMPSELKLNKGKPSIGFLRFNTLWSLTGQWHLTAPGYFRQEVVDDGQSVTIHWQDREIWASSIEFPSHMVAQNFFKDHKDASEAVAELTENDRLGWAKVKRVTENGQSLFQLDGQVLMQNSVCIITITYEKADSKDWALNTWRSLKIG